MNWPRPHPDQRAGDPRRWPIGLLVSLGLHAAGLAVLLISVGHAPLSPTGLLQPPAPVREQTIVLPPLPASAAAPVVRQRVEPRRTAPRRRAPTPPAASVARADSGVPVAVVSESASAPLDTTPSRISPSLGDARLWTRPLPLPPQELAQRLRRTNKQLADSVVTATVQAFLDSIAREPGAATQLPDWTTNLGGKKYGIDGRNIYIAGLKIPAAVLALLPIPATGNYDQAKAAQRIEAMRADLLQAAQRAENVAEFKKAIKEIRERKEREREFERNQRTPPPPIPPDTTKAAKP